jgi:Site-specific DNA methylase
MSPPIAWMGGKRSILQEILMRFPLRFERYIEVFGGSGVVLFGKPPNAFEVWNDYNGDLYNFYHCVKYKHLQLLHELKFLPLCSRAEFVQLRTFLAGEPPPKVDLEAEQDVARRHFSAVDAAELCDILTTRCQLGDVHRAAAFFKLNHMSYGAGMTSFSARPCDLRRFYRQVSAAHERLSGIILENKDFEGIIKQYDRPGSFFYLDPPYVEAEGCYEVAFSQDDHYRLFEALCEVEGKWLLSYNDCKFVRRLYRRFYQYRFTRISNLNQRYEGGAKYKEILISNYDMNERGRQHEQLSII